MSCKLHNLLVLIFLSGWLGDARSETVQAAISLEAPTELTEMSGLALERDLEFGAATRKYQAEIELAEETLGPYHRDLFEPLMGLARSQYRIADYDGALASTQRAQHISHRHNGVHSSRQLEGVELMTQIYLAQNEPLLADKQQRFAFYVSTHNIPNDSLELLPSLEKLADWYSKTGQLHRARKLNERGIEIVEANFGEDSIQQLPYLQQLAKLKRLQRVCCSTRVMEQALDLIDRNPNLSSDIKANTYLEVADAYTVSGNERDASTYYQKAWSLMNETARQENFATPQRIVSSQPLNERKRLDARIYRVGQDPFGRREFRQVRDDELLQMASLPPQEFVVAEDDSDYNVRIRDRTVSRDYEQEAAMRTVGSPFTFLHTQLLQILPSRFRRDERLDEVAVELQFDIDQYGHTQNIEVLTQNTPGKLSRMMREVVRKTRFRPRMEDGILVTTNRYRLIQTFQI